MHLLYSHYSSGTFNGYGLTLDTIVTKCGISQAEAGYIGFAALLSCVPANLIIGGLGGMFPRRKVCYTELEPFVHFILL